MFQIVLMFSRKSPAAPPKMDGADAAAAEAPKNPPAAGAGAAPKAGALPSPPPNKLEAVLAPNAAGVAALAPNPKAGCDAAAAPNMPARRVVRPIS